jgi:putative NIF3 family GTP cyclohydrolase 1 type 2
VGNGTVRGTEKSNPVVGEKGIFEIVGEAKIEVLVNSWKLNKVIRAIKQSHPYEQPAYDIYAVKNENVNFGFGVIGQLKNSLNTQEFLNHVCVTLNTSSIRYAKGRNNKIKTVAVCGGSGSELLEAAIAKNADAFVTADIKYHPFHDAENKILFIDAGHYETEILILDVVKTKIEEFVNNIGEQVKVFKYSGSTNPVKYFNK